MKSKDDKNLLEAYSAVLKENSCGIMGDMIVAPTETGHPEQTDPSREQEEVEMDDNNASIILQKANDLSSLLKSGFKLEPWMQQKITLAADYLASVTDTAMADQSKTVTYKKLPYEY